MNELANKYLQGIKNYNEHVSTLVKEEGINQNDFNKVISWKHDCEGNTDLFIKGLKKLTEIKLSNELFEMLDNYIMYDEIIRFMQEDDCDLYKTIEYDRSGSDYDLYILVVKDKFGTEIYEIDETNITFSECEDNEIVEKVKQRYS